MVYNIKNYVFSVIKMIFKKKQKATEKFQKIVVSENNLLDTANGYNRLRDNILFINADGDKKVIQMGSAVAKEGKTTICSNLAVSLGLTEKKVVVVDLDFRKPKIHRMFEEDMENGIAEYVLGTATLNDVIKPTKYKNVDIITRGEKIYNVSLVLLSNKFAELINSLKEKYDFVLLDCAPILQVSDYIHIGTVADGMLFVVAHELTTKNMVADAVKEAKKNGINLLGTVFSMYDPRSATGRYYYGYSNKYNYYRSYYQENKDK